MGTLAVGMLSDSERIDEAVASTRKANPTSEKQVLFARGLELENTCSYVPVWHDLNTSSCTYSTTNFVP